MKILHIVGGLPTKERPFFQPFTKAQIDSLIKAGLQIEILNLKGYESSLNYITYALKVKKIVDKEKINLIHAHYGYSGIAAILARPKVPIVLSFTRE